MRRMNDFLSQFNGRSEAEVWRQRALESEKQLRAACDVAMRVGITLPDDSPLREEWETELKPKATAALLHWTMCQGWEPRTLGGVTQLVAVE